MINTDRYGFVFVSAYGPEGVITVNEMATALSHETTRKLSLAYDANADRFSILGSCGMRKEQIKKIFSSMGELLVVPKILNETDLNGNSLIELQKLEDAYDGVEYKSLNEKNIQSQEHKRIVREFWKAHGSKYSNKWRAVHDFDQLMQGLPLNRMSKF